MSARATMPPTTPPAIAPVLDDFFPEEGEEEGGTMVEEEVDALGLLVLEGVCPPTPEAVADVVDTLELLINTPAGISGVSKERNLWLRQLLGQMGGSACVPPIACAVRLFQRFTFCKRMGHMLYWGFWKVRIWGFWKVRMGETNGDILESPLRYTCS